MDPGLPVWLGADSLWNGLGWPLVRLSFFISFGLIIGNLIEALNWTHGVARIATPLIKRAHLKDTSGAAFSMAFFSGVAANTMLSEAYETGRLTRKELILSNLFNSLPTYFLHLPTMFFITAPFLGGAAVLYVGLTLCSAFLRTGFIVLWGRITLPTLPDGCVTCELDGQKSPTWREAVKKALKRFNKRIRKVLTFTVPIYILVFVLNKAGAFKAFEHFLADNLTFLSWLHPKAISIVVFHVASEFTAGLAVASALLEADAIPVRDVVLALLVGNVLSSPMRAFRHQFPFYAGIFRPALAARLITYSQTLRAVSVAIVTVIYAAVT